MQDRSRGSPEAAQVQTQVDVHAGGHRGRQSPSRMDQVCLSGATLGPSISEPDLTSVKERVRKEPVKERPVSEMFAIEDSIVEREIAQRVRKTSTSLAMSFSFICIQSDLHTLPRRLI